MLNELNRQPVFWVVSSLKEKWKQGPGQGPKDIVSRPKLRSCAMMKVNSESISAFNFICIAYIEVEMQSTGSKQLFIFGSNHQQVSNLIYDSQN